MAEPQMPFKEVTREEIASLRAHPAQIALAAWFAKIVWDRSGRLHWPDAPEDMKEALKVAARCGGQDDITDAEKAEIEPLLQRVRENTIGALGFHVPRKDQVIRPALANAALAALEAAHAVHGEAAGWANVAYRYASLVAQGGAYDSAFLEWTRIAFDALVEHARGTDMPNSGAVSAEFFDSF